MRVCIALLVFLGFMASARAQGEVPISPDAMINAAKEAEFFASVAIGDRERAAGHVPEAAMAYARAIQIRKDPVVGGRLGVLLVQAEKYSQAADLLQIALKYARTTTAERETYFRAYEVARLHGAWVDVIISEAGAAVLLDDEERNPSGYSAFSTFVPLGAHRLRATLEGFYEAEAEIDVHPGEDKRVQLTLRPLFRKLARSRPTPALSTNVVGDPKYSSKEDPFYTPPNAEKPKDEDPKGFHGSVVVGPVVLFGVASWMPAVGGMIGAAWEPNQYFSLGLEGRAAWLTVGVGGEPISAMTAGGLLSACGHVKWFFGCALGHLGVTNIEFGSETFTGKKYSIFQPGIGGRVGVRVPLTRTFALRGSIEALRLRTGIKVVGEQTVFADLPPVMIGAQIGAELEW